METTRRLQLVPPTGAPERNSVRTPDEPYVPIMVRDARSSDLVAPPIYATRAKLFGGVADGCSVELSSLSSEILVHVDEEGRAHAVDTSVGERPEPGLSLYRLVNPTGPEEPTYAAPSI